MSYEGLIKSFLGDDYCINMSSGELLRHPRETDYNNNMAMPYRWHTKLYVWNNNSVPIPYGWVFKSSMYAVMMSSIRIRKSFLWDSKYICVIHVIAIRPYEISTRAMSYKWVIDASLWYDFHVISCGWVTKSSIWDRIFERRKKKIFIITSKKEANPLIPMRVS